MTQSHLVSLDNATIALFPMLSANHFAYQLLPENTIGVAPFPKIVKQRLETRWKKTTTNNTSAHQIDFVLVNAKMDLSSDKIQNYCESLNLGKKSRIIWVIAPKVVCDHIQKMTEERGGKLYYYNSIGATDSLHYILTGNPGPILVVELSSN